MFGESSAPQHQNSGPALPPLIFTFLKKNYLRAREDSLCSEITKRKAEFHFVRETWDLHDFGHINQGIEELNGDKVIEKRQTNDLGLFQLQIEFFHNELEEKTLEILFLDSM